MCQRGAGHFFLLRKDATDFFFVLLNPTLKLFLGLCSHVTRVLSVYLQVEVVGKVDRILCLMGHVERDRAPI